MKMAISRLDQSLDILQAKEKIITRNQGLQAIKIMKKRQSKGKDACRISWQIYASELGNYITENRLSINNFLPVPSVTELTIAAERIAKDPHLLIWWQLEVDVKDFKKLKGIVIKYDSHTKKHELLIKQESMYFRRIVRLDHRQKLKATTKDNSTFDLVCYLPLSNRPKNVEVLGLTKKELEAYKERTEKENKKLAKEKAKEAKKQAKKKK
jgi:hypothetical protein